MISAVFFWCLGTFLSILPLAFFFHNDNSERPIKHSLRNLDYSSFNKNENGFVNEERILSGGGAYRFSNSEMIILWVFSTIFVGALFREINKLTKFPYTPMI